MEIRQLVDATLTLLAQAEAELQEAQERVEAARADVENHTRLISVLRAAHEKIERLEAQLFRRSR